MDLDLPAEITKFKKISKVFLWLTLCVLGLFLVFALWGIIDDSKQKAAGNYNDSFGYVLIAFFFGAMVIAGIFAMFMVIFWVIYRVKRAKTLKSQSDKKIFSIFGWLFLVIGGLLFADLLVFAMFFQGMSSWVDLNSFQYFFVDTGSVIGDNLYLPIFSVILGFLFLYIYKKRD
jgi:hypothetical protein